MVWMVFMGKLVEVTKEEKGAFEEARAWHDTEDNEGRTPFQIFSKALELLADEKYDKCTVETTEDEIKINLDGGWIKIGRDGYVEMGHPAA